MLVSLTETVMEAGRIGHLQGDSLHLWGCQDLSWSIHKPRADVLGLRASVGPDTSREPEVGGWGRILALFAFTCREPQAAGFGHWTDPLPTHVKTTLNLQAPNMHGAKRQGLFLGFLTGIFWTASSEVVPIPDVCPLGNPVDAKRVSWPLGTSVFLSEPYRLVVSLWHLLLFLLLESMHHRPGTGVDPCNAVLL